MCPNNRRSSIVNALSRRPFFRCKGVLKENPILVSLLGVVWNVSEGADFFEPGGPYEVGKKCMLCGCAVARLELPHTHPALQVFAGGDASYALAVMSLDSKNVNIFNYTLEEGLYLSFPDTRRTFWHPVVLGHPRVPETILSF